MVFKCFAHHTEHYLAIIATRPPTNGLLTCDTHHFRTCNESELICNNRRPREIFGQNIWPTAEQCVETGGRKHGGSERIWICHFVQLPGKYLQWLQHFCIRITLAIIASIAHKAVQENRLRLATSDRSQNPGAQQYLS